WGPMSSCTERAPLRRGRRALFVFAAALALASSGCGPGRNKLSGSAREQYDLRFDQVKAEWIVDELVLRYLSGEGRGGREPLRLTLPRAAAKTGEEIPIGLARLEHFVAVRNPDGTVNEEPPFGAVESGWVRLEEIGATPGEAARGTFSAHFEDGHTLGGGFDVSLSAP
ncbi:MAG: hypothetical protein ACYC8T_39530, partial [Myxococcaceae bacterium]